MKRSAYYSITFLTIILLGVVTEKKCNAIPAFARKYQISCQVCHAPAMPRLKGFGEEFAANGFKLTEYQSPRFFIPTGDDRLSLYREMPLAFRIDGFATYNYDNEKRSDFGSPFVLKILSGGEMSDNISYYFYFLMNETGSIVGVEDAFIMYQDLFKTGINFYIGQFQASDPMFKGELRYTMEPYKMYGTKPGNSMVDLKYERGIILEKGFSSGTSFLAQILNGSGLEPAGENKLFDKDKHKNYMLRLSQEIGEKFIIGAFGYYGKEDLENNIDFFTNTINMYGSDIKLNFNDKFIFGLQYIWRTDSDVFIEDNNTMLGEVKTQGGFGEITFSPKGDQSKWYLTGLVNYVNSDIIGFDDKKELDYASATLHFGYLVRRNFRLLAETTYQFNNHEHVRFNLGFSTAF